MTAQENLTCDVAVEAFFFKLGTSFNEESVSLSEICASIADFPDFDNFMLFFNVFISLF